MKFSIHYIYIPYNKNSTKTIKWGIKGLITQQLILIELYKPK